MLGCKGLRISIIRASLMYSAFKIFFVLFFDDQMRYKVFSIPFSPFGRFFFSKKTNKKIRLRDKSLVQAKKNKLYLQQLKNTM